MSNNVTVTPDFPVIPAHADSQEAASCTGLLPDGIDFSFTSVSLHPSADTEIVISPGSPVERMTASTLPLKVVRSES